MSAALPSKGVSVTTPDLFNIAKANEMAIEIGIKIQLLIIPAKAKGKQNVNNHKKNNVK